MGHPPQRFAKMKIIWENNKLITVVISGGDGNRK
jgi:hypothetical protein